jgi:hypothetical protein
MDPSRVGKPPNETPKRWTNGACGAPTSDEHLRIDMLSDSILSEMLSQSIHAERLADAERQRFASAACRESSSVRAASDDPSHRRLAHALQTFVARAARLLYEPDRAPSPR